MGFALGVVVGVLSVAFLLAGVVFVYGIRLFGSINR